MNKVIFRGPEEIVINDVNNLKKSLIDDFDTFWLQGSGDGFIDYFVDNKKVSVLMLGPNIGYGLYLHYIDCINNVDLLSLYDEGRLGEVAETAEEIMHQ